MPAAEPLDLCAHDGLLTARECEAGARFGMLHRAVHSPRGPTLPAWYGRAAGSTLGRGAQTGQPATTGPARVSVVTDYGRQGRGKTRPSRYAGGGYTCYFGSGIPRRTLQGLAQELLTVFEAAYQHLYRKGTPADQREALSTALAACMVVCKERC